MMKDLEKIDFDLAPKLKSLTMPISIIIGKDDPISFLIPDYQKSIPKAEVLWMNKAGHYPMYEQPNEFYTKLMEALKK
jgi:pimeloyl-ACP methyl ester carboxylesterase